MRITQHPILSERELTQRVYVTVDGRGIEAIKGEPIASALLAAGIKTFRRTRLRKEPRGYFCGIGLCNDCMMIVNGTPNVRTCVTPVEEGMIIETQAT